MNLGQIEVLYAVSPEVCLASVADDPDAKGFSFYYAYDGFDTICVIFGNLEGEAECSHECTSFKKPSEDNNCVCSKQEGTACPSEVVARGGHRSWLIG